MAEGDHYREAERLSRATLRYPHKDVSELPLDDVLAVADQLARVAERLTTLVQVQQERG